MSSAILLLAMTLSSDVAVHGHRGARAVLPENTMPALEHALDAGVDYLELDLGVTKDGHLVLLHDQEIAPTRCTRITGSRLPERVPVRELTLAEVKTLDCGRLKNARFPKQRTVKGARIPTFDEVLSWLNASQHPRAAKVQLNAETKIVPGRPQHSPPPEEFAALFVDAVRRHNFVGRTVLQSFDHRVLLAAAKLEPKLRRSALVAESRPDFLAVAKASQAHIVSPNHEWITEEDVRAMHAAGLQVHPWTANEPAAWDRLLAMGVDGIITDDPKALIAHLKKLKKGAD
jgi:glycerophosphoryl diester phosphodiesterase